MRLAPGLATLVTGSLLLSRPLAALQADLTHSAGTVSPPHVVPHESAPAVRAAPLTGSIHLDGHLDEAAWEGAPVNNRFTQALPKPGEPPGDSTEVRLLVSGDAIYIGARLYVKDLSGMRPRLARKDESVSGDVFSVGIDSRHDHLSSYYFRVTAGGAMRDAVLSGVGNNQNFDLSWDAVWDAKVSRDPLGVVPVIGRAHVMGPGAQPPQIRPQ